MVRTRIKTPEKVDGAEEILPAEAAAIAVTDVETRQYENMHLKEKWKTVWFPNY